MKKQLPETTCKVLTNIEQMIALKLKESDNPYVNEIMTRVNFLLEEIFAEESKRIINELELLRAIQNYYFKTQIDNSMLNNLENRSSTNHEKSGEDHS